MVASVPSATYELFRQAMAERRQLHCRFDGLRRELCPIILGHTGGREVALAFQFGGDTSRGPIHPPGDWRCLDLSRVTEIELRDGAWHAGGSHSSAQSCVRQVDFDVNPLSPYNPARRL